MEIQPFILGGYGVSAYVVSADGDVMVIDAPEGSQAIIEFCEARGLVPRLLVNTHGHGDHIYGNAALKARWPDMELAIGAGDEPMLRSVVKNLSLLFAKPVRGPKADRLLRDGDRVEVGSAAFEVLATPGHTPGGISLYAKDGPGGRPVVFTGDALFAGGIGRTDFPGASGETLLASIRNRLLALPPETVVYPGHGPATTIGEEATSNPWL